MARKLTRRIHVNQHHIRANAKAGNAELPVLSVKTYKDNTLANELAIVKDGVEIARLRYEPDNPLSCGARVWLETQEDVHVIR